MKALFPIALVIAMTSSGAALASDDCHRPMAEWQSRENVTAHVTERGITTERLRIDDGGGVHFGYCGLCCHSSNVLTRPVQSRLLLGAPWT